MGDCTSFRVEGEKVKMAFSSTAKSDVQFTVPSVYEGEDVEGSISKEEFDALCRGGDNFIETFYPFAISSIHEICGDRAIDDVKVVGCSMLVCPPGRAPEGCPPSRLFDFRDSHLDGHG